MCVLKIHSKTRSFKDQPALRSLPVYSIHNKGEVRQKRTGKLYDNNRVSLDVSDAEWDEFPKQTNEAIEFLKQNREALLELLNAAEDIEGYLDFPLWSRLNGEIVNQNDHIPKELISIAGELGIGIEMSIYAADSFDFVDNTDSINKETEQEMATPMKVPD